MIVMDRCHYTELDKMAQREKNLTMAGGNDEIFYLQIYFPDPNSPDDPYSEENSEKILLTHEEWQQIDVYISDPGALRDGKLRLKPLNTRGFVFISGLRLVNKATGGPCRPSGREDTGFSVERDALLLADGDTIEMAVTGDDPTLLLPEMPDLPDCPISLEMWIKVSSNQSALHRYWEEMKRERERFREKEQAFTEVKNILRGQEQDLATVQKDIRKKDASLKHLDEQLTLRDGELAGLNERLKDKDQSLQNQKNLITEYFNALAESEAKQVRLTEQVVRLRDTKNQLQQKLKEERDQFRAKILSLRQERAQLQRWMKVLHRQYVSLVNSRRWRLGNAIVKYFGVVFGRSGQAKGIVRMQEIFVAFQKYLKSRNAAEGPGQTGVDGPKMIRWMERLQKDFKRVMDSRIWRFGNGLINAAAALILQKRKPVSVIRMKGIFNDFQEWRGNMNPNSLTHQEIKQITGWLNRLEKDFNSLFASRRWRLGKALSFPVRIFRRGAGPGVVERVKMVFEEYHA
jgi:predicted  nucleic acid-binding Zn-ribbon protein